MDKQRYHLPAELILQQARLHDLGLPADLSEQLCKLADDAGAVLLAHYHSATELSVERKADSSPVTQADKDSHDFIVRELMKLTPQLPILSEESQAEDVIHRLQWSACWVVDPLDGTKEFINGTGQFTINIALVVEGRPVIGLISIPIEGKHYLGIPGQGAWCIDATTVRGLQVNCLDRSCPLRVLASERHELRRVQEVMAKLEPACGTTERVNAGSAIKFCRLVEGDAEIYPRTSPCYEWDVAAGDALVCGAGGVLTDFSGEPLRYNQRQQLLVTEFVAGCQSEIDWHSFL